MKFTPSRLKQAELSDREKIALRGVAEGGFIALPLCQRLQKLGLVEKRHDGWTITPQGHIRLMFQGAR
jgi:ribosomal protein S19E (S16A)